MVDAGSGIESDDGFGLLGPWGPSDCSICVVSYREYAAEWAMRLSYCPQRTRNAITKSKTRMRTAAVITAFVVDSPTPSAPFFA